MLTKILETWSLGGPSGPDFVLQANRPTQVTEIFFSKFHVGVRAQ